MEAMPGVAFDTAAGTGIPMRDVGGVNDYGTNNQEEGVEEGDIVVANESFMFVAYGDYVVRDCDSENAVCFLVVTLF